MTKLTSNGLSEPGTYLVLDSQEKSEESSKLNDNYNVTIYWRSVILIILLHLAALYGAYLGFTSAKFQTILWAILLYQLSGFGITAGAHRYWSHHSFKAKWPLQVFLIICHSMAFQFKAYNWVRDHRVHHKFVDTNADPYNAKRGFFFSHIGWLLCRKHPDVIKKGRSISMKDLDDDPIVQFQKRHYFSMVALWCFIIPTIVPAYFWGETLYNALYVAVSFRHIFVTHGTGLVNSAAHYWGYRPYEKSISPTDNLGVSVVALGEGWHNYHHTFPWDYKAAELGNYRANFTTGLIDFFAIIGWAYDLKTAPLSLVHKRAQRTGTNMQNGDHAEI